MDGHDHKYNHLTRMSIHSTTNIVFEKSVESVGADNESRNVEFISNDVPQGFVLTEVHVPVQEYVHNAPMVGSPHSN